MNSGFRDLPITIPFRERARIMVQRGEAPDFGAAVRMLRQKPKFDKVPPKQTPVVAAPAGPMWYNND